MGTTTRSMKILKDHQSEKPCKLIRQTYEGCDFEGDPRFRDYAQALKEGNLDVCSELREHWRDDREIITKFQTIERMWIAMMARYAREIQISQREREGYRILSEGLQKKLDKERTYPWYGTQIRRGKAIVEQAEAARDGHDEVSFPRVFSQIK